MNSKSPSKNHYDTAKPQNEGLATKNILIKTCHFQEGIAFNNLAEFSCPKKMLFNVIRIPTRILLLNIIIQFLDTGFVATFALFHIIQRFSPKQREKLPNQCFKNIMF